MIMQLDFANCCLETEYTVEGLALKQIQLRGQGIRTGLWLFPCHPVEPHFYKLQPSHYFKGTWSTNYSKAKDLFSLALITTSTSTSSETLLGLDFTTFDAYSTEKLCVLSLPPKRKRQRGGGGGGGERERGRGR